MSITTNSIRKNWRKLVKKLRRKRKRQSLAEARNRNCDIKLSDVEDEDEIHSDEDKRKIEHDRWLQEEERSQMEWKEKERVRLEQQRLKTKVQAQIRAEWESVRKQKLEKKKNEEEAQAALQAKIQNFISHGGPTPEELLIIRETNPDRDPCPFYSKVGACRFGTACSRNHTMPSISKILLIVNCYTHFSLMHNRSEYDTDVNLEFDDKEMNYDFREFFDDFVPELEKHGSVRVIQVCRNSENHLRGNLYAEYSNEREALSAARTLNARWYGGRQLSVSFVHIPDWGSAICGDFHRGRCPKGNQCNFLHTFRNPRGYFMPEKKYKEEKKQRESTVRSWRWSESPDREIKSDEKRHRLRSKKSTTQSDLHVARRNRSSRSSSRESRSRHKSSHNGASRSRSRERRRSSTRYRERRQLEDKSDPSEQKRKRTMVGVS